MDPVGVRELSHHTSRYLAQVKAGRTLGVTEHGRIIAVITPAGDERRARRPRPRIGGYRSEAPMSAEEIDEALAAGFGDDAAR